jgi:hypothetical protein
MTMYKNKLEEITAMKEKEKSGGNINPMNPTNSTNVNITTDNTKEDKHAVKPRARKRDTSMLKSVKNTLAKSQKKFEMDRQKKDTQNTLETFLDNKPKNVRETSSQFRLDTDMASNVGESHNFETYTKFSEVSKSEAPNTVNLANETGFNAINLNVFKHYIPSQNTKIPYSTNVKRRITLKDLIYYLETERAIPYYNLILHKAIVKLNQYSSH